MIGTLCKATRTLDVNVVLWVAVRSFTSQDLTSRYQSNSTNIRQMGEQIIKLNGFLFHCWTRCDPGILGNILLVVSHGKVCHSIVVNDAVVTVTEVPDLFSDHEETDTRFLLHALPTRLIMSSAVCPLKVPIHMLWYYPWPNPTTFMVVSCFS